MNKKYLYEKYLYEKYLEYYYRVDLHHKMSFENFMNDAFIYKQIKLIYNDELDYKQWYNREFRVEKLLSILN